ncbi:MFS transporter [Krasilnikovia sp. M28-CT-15]|uniref:MFS transporter n=1 Tax=Krasilnikovia sp. M28-CT-15 TaxID=3373540 RepID=UPI00399D0AEB
MTRRLYAVRGCEEGILLYPLYALLFADAGLSTAQISSLFVIWSVVSFVCEVPSGAWADAWSRRRLYALGSFLIAAGYATWILWPAYPGFALGFVLWGVGGAMQSGTLEALVYDELAAVGAADTYARVTGRSGTVGILAMLAATTLAAPAYALGGYPLIGALSVAVPVVGGCLALGFPETPHRESSDEFGGLRGYATTLAAGLREVNGSRFVARAVALAALVPGFTALDEYLPLLSRTAGAPTALVPLLFALPALGMAVGSALAGRWAAIAPRRLGAMLAGAAGLLAAGALSRHLAGMVPIAVAFGALQFAIVVSETRLQEVIGSRTRATVLSVSGFAAEVCAVLIYAGVGAGGAIAPMPVLVACCAVPLLGTALMAARWLPTHQLRPTALSRMDSAGPVASATDPATN